MHRVGADTAARGVDVAELRKRATGGVSVELGQRLGLVLVAAGPGPVVKVGINHAGASVVVGPGLVSLGQLLEDGSLLESVLSISETSIICTMACRGT